MCAPQAQPYRRRAPQESPLYQLIRDHLAGLKECWRERFEKSHGPWRAHWDRYLERYLRCGDLSFGFARVRCPTCASEYILPHSCRVRALCPSCEGKRRAALAEHVRLDVLPDVPHAMLVFTIPRCLRRIFSRDHELLGELARLTYASIKDFFRAHFPGVDGYPHVVLAIQSSGSLLNDHVHIHSIVSLGLTDRAGTFHPACEDLDFSPILEIFRHRVLGFLREKKRLSESFYHRISRWNPSGFSVDSSVRIPRGNPQALERIAAYIVHPPLSLERLEYSPQGKTAIYRGRMNPALGRNFEALDPKELLARLLVLLPEPYEVWIRYYGAASSTWRRKNRPREDRPQDASGAEDPSTFQVVRRKQWARMIQRTFHADPLICPRCGSRMRIISCIDDEEVVEKILRHLGLWKPPGPARAPPSRDPQGPEDPPRDSWVDYDDFSLTD